MRAEPQEQKLIDRLLRPNLSVTNPAQGKRFANTQSIPAAQEEQRQVTAGGSAMESGKQFARSGNFFARMFRTRPFHGSSRPADLSTRSQQQTGTFATVNSSAPHTAHEAEQRVASREYTGTREFLGRGKSQKALSAHDTPLTIDEVRELLNRNK